MTVQHVVIVKCDMLGCRASVKIDVDHSGYKTKLRRLGWKIVGAPELHICPAGHSSASHPRRLRSVK